MGALSAPEPVSWRTSGARRRAGAGELLDVRGGDQAGAGTTSGSCSNFGSQCRPLGRYQLRVPRSFIVAGRRTARTIVASIRMAAARPTPSCLLSRLPPLAEAPDRADLTPAGRGGGEPREGGQQCRGGGGYPPGRFFGARGGRVSRGTGRGGQAGGGGGGQTGGSPSRDQTPPRTETGGAGG